MSHTNGTDRPALPEPSPPPWLTFGALPEFYRPIASARAMRAACSVAGASLLCDLFDRQGRSAPPKNVDWE